MEWSEAEKARLMCAWCPGTHEAQACAVANCALELVRARGGTLEAQRLTETIQDISDAGMPVHAADLREHAFSLGSRIAMLEAELRECQRTRAEASARAEEAERLAINRQVECERLRAVALDKHVP